MSKKKRCAAKGGKWVKVRKYKGCRGLSRKKKKTPSTAVVVAGRGWNDTMAKVKAFHDRVKSGRWVSKGLRGAAGILPAGKWRDRSQKWGYTAYQHGYGLNLPGQY
jgi:hypothetical protein